MRIILATFNRDKVRELSALLADRPVEVGGLFDLPGASAPAETGANALENARIKARYAHELTGLTCIADDTALEVDALGGKPGIHAARLAGPGATYADNLRRLLEIMTGVEPARRTARFRSVCVACLESGGERHGEGVLEGRITESPRGAHGFGYDPIFEVEGLGRTLAEMPAPEKNRLSHRARAVEALFAELRRVPKLGHHFE
jgi:XTP/dITP diphosphohydrolase